jgi:DNA (cytosine-5)-methyltransferase 1
VNGVSLFSGIEGFGLALLRAGIHVSAAVEIDPACLGVTGRHFPSTAQFGDVTEVTGDQLTAAGFVPGTGIITGGFPCQDLSIAGRRTGLGGARSGLFWQIMRLADELRPRWLLLENVPGLLSAVCSCPGDDTCTSNGRAVRCGVEYYVRDEDGVHIRLEFAANVPHPVKGGACAGGCMERHGGAMGTVLGALGERGYGFAYRVLDAQFFGVPQRRERVFIAGCAGDWAAPVQVLLEPESGGGDPAAGWAAGAGAAGSSGNGAGDAGTVGTLSTLSPGGGWRIGADEAAAGQLAVYSRNFDHEWTEGAGALRAQEGGTAGQLVTTLQGGGRRGHRIDAEGAAGGHLITHTITARKRKGTDSDATSGIIVTEDDANLVPVTFNWQSGGDVRLGVSDKPGALSAQQTPAVAFPVALRGREDGSAIEAGEDGEAAFTLRTPGGGSSYPMAATTEAVRRLTPRECERLQGFPDDWTRWLADGTEQSDSARYRQCGNAVAVPVVEWIARRITDAERAA